MVVVIWRKSYLVGLRGLYQDVRVASSSVQVQSKSHSQKQNLENVRPVGNPANQNSML